MLEESEIWRIPASGKWQQLMKGRRIKISVMMRADFCYDFDLKAEKIPGDRGVYDETKICYLMRRTSLWLKAEF